MKIIYCITKTDNSGTQTYLIQLANRFCIHHDVYVTVGSRGLMTEQLDARVNIIIIEHLVGLIDFEQDILAVEVLAQLFLKIKPGIIHLHSSRTRTVGRIVRFISKSKDTCVVLTAHGWAFTGGVKPAKKFPYLAIEKLMSRVTDSIICVSDLDKRSALEYRLNRLKLTTIHNGAAGVPAVRQTLKSQSHNNVGKVVEMLPNKQDLQINDLTKHQFVMTVRFAYPKLPQDLIAAIEILKLHNSNHAHFTFVDDEPTLNDCQQQVVQAGLEDDVTFLGGATNVSHLLSQYDAFTLIGKHKGLPTSTAEVMATGLPVIVNHVGGISELVIDSGVCIVNSQPETITRVLEKYLIDSDYIKMSNQSRKRYLECFAKEKMTKGVEDVYNGRSTQ